MILDSSPARADLVLNVRETAGRARAGEVIHNGIPLGRSLNLTDPAGLQIRNAAGTAVPAQFEVLSRWGGGRAGGQPIQWLMVTFPADCAAGQTRQFRLAQGANPAPATALTVTEGATQIMVNTGAGRFVISKTAFNVLEQAFLIQGGTERAIVNQGAGSATVEVQGLGPLTAQAPESVAVEHAGPLFVTVKVAGHFDHPPAGGVALRYLARYSFRAGDPAFDLDFSLAWPGSFNGEAIDSLSSTELNADTPREGCLLLDRARLSIPLALSGTTGAFAGAEQAKSLSGTLGAHEMVRLAQLRRPAMAAPAQYQAALGSRTLAGGFAREPFVAVLGSQGGIGVSIQQMHFYEPQAMTATSQTLTLDPIAEPQWLGPFMGGFARMAVTLIPPGGDLAMAAEQTVGRLDHGLLAWPGQRDAANSLCFGELWDGTPHPKAAPFMARLQTITSNTLEGYARYGMHGFMTYGVGVRYWRPDYQEFGSETNLWDGYFFGGTFTDYHHTYANVTRLFALTGEGELLQTLAWPAARRMLHTQIIQVNPDNEGFFGGWAPIGYRAYRTDSNSSHSYFENLFFYYYLTGDRQVLDTLLPAGEHKRRAYTRDAEGSLVPPGDPTPVDWVVCNGRVGSQTAGMFWFLGHASADATFLDDYKNYNERFVARHTALLKAGGKEYAFCTSDDIAANPHQMTTDQFWMLALYNLNDVWKLYQEYGDLALGPDGIKISRLFKAHQLAFWDYAAKIHNGGTGTADGIWARQAVVTWSGARIGGTITSAAPVTDGETYLYYEDKGAIASLAYRAAALNGQDAAMRAQGAEMFDFVFGSFDPTGKPWDKSCGVQFFLGHAALAGIANRAPVAAASQPETWGGYE